MHRASRLAIVALFAAAALSLQAEADAPAAERAVNSVPAATAVRMRVPNVQFDHVAFADVLDFMRDATGLNLYVNWPALEAAGVDRSTPVTLRLRQIPLRTVLDLTLRQVDNSGTNLTWYISDNVVYVTTRELAGAQMITQVFDVRDLLVNVPDFTDAPNFNLGSGNSGSSGSGPFEGGGGNGGGEAPESQQARGEELVELIKMLVQPDIWIENGGFSSIRFFNGSLIVTAPRDVLLRIGR